MHWFKDNKRDLPWRRESEPYRILIAEKLLQQTDVGHVLKVYDDFFKKYPTLQALAEVKQRDVENTIRPLGFWRIRARDFKNMAKQLLDEYSGEIPRDKQELLEVFGVGRYVADAVACFGFGKKEAVVDVNVRRVAKRLFFWKSELPDDAELSQLMYQLIPQGKSKDFNWALLDFSALVCRRTPCCSRCFAQDLCEYYLARSDMIEIRKRPAHLFKKP